MLLCWGLSSDRLPVQPTLSERWTLSQAGVYVRVVDAIQRLRDASNLTCSARELDRYLWLAGCHRRWSAGS